MLNVKIWMVVRFGV